MIGEIHVKTVLHPGEPDRLAYADLTVGGVLRVHGLEIVRADRLVSVRWPRRAVPAPCDDCQRMIGVGDCFCRHCGRRQAPTRSGPQTRRGVAIREWEGVHPVNDEVRAAIQEDVLHAWLTAIGCGPRLHRAARDEEETATIRFRPSGSPC